MGERAACVGFRGGQGKLRWGEIKNNNMKSESGFYCVLNFWYSWGLALCASRPCAIDSSHVGFFVFVYVHFVVAVPRAPCCAPHDPEPPLCLPDPSPLVGGAHTV